MKTLKTLWNKLIAKPNLDGTAKLISYLENEVNNKDDPEQKEIAAMKVELVKLIFPELLKSVEATSDSGGFSAVLDKKLAKQWAYALAGTLGLVTGLSVKPGKADIAISEVMGHCRKIAKQFNSPKNQPGATTSAPVKAEQSAIVTDALKAHIASLETQAAATDKLEEKVALLDMAEKLRAEMDTNKKAA